MRNAELDELHPRIKIGGRNINNITCADDTTLVAESEEELKSLLMRVKESERAGLKLNIKKTKIMASDSVISWQIEGESQSSDRFFLLGIQNHCAWWNASSMKCTAAKKLEDICFLAAKPWQTWTVYWKADTLPTKVCIVKAMVFPVVMFSYESWTIKKAKCQRIDAFERWCWRRLLRVPWTARSSS